jgi:hypothetical protein
MKMIKTKKPSSCPQCPDEVTWEPDPSYDSPNCICGKPLLLYIPAGQHIHCPVHPDYRIFSSSPWCGTSEPGSTPYSGTTTGNGLFDGRPKFTAIGGTWKLDDGHINMNTLHDGHETIC